MISRDKQTSRAIGPPLPTPLPTFGQLLAGVAETYADELALVCIHQRHDHLPIDFPQDLCLPNTNGHAIGDTKSQYLRWTHGQLRYAGQLLAKGLASQGVRAGQGIVTVMFNCVEWMMLVQAAAILRCPLVPLNARSLANLGEFEHMMSLSEAKILVVPDVKSVEKLEQEEAKLLKRLELRVVLGSEEVQGTSSTWLSLNSLLRQDDQTHHDGHMNGTNGSHKGGDAELVMTIFTSGTTSAPKGAVYTNTTMSACLLAVVQATQLNRSSRLCGHMPNHHIGGIGMVLGFLVAGGSVVFPSPAFNPEASLDAVNSEKCTNLPCVPAMVQAMADHPKLETTDTSSLTSVQMGATTILPEHLKLVYSAFKCKRVSNSFSATESTPTTMRFHDATKLGSEVSVGTMVPGASLKICAPDTREPLPRGEPGEMHICGAQVIPGYLGNIAAGSFYEDEDGRWFVTGDQAIMSEDGEVTISGRYKDMIIRGGENIAPSAIEAVFDAKLGISAQVVGVLSDIAGEVPVAVLQPKKDQALPTMGEVRHVLVKSLGPAFVPEQFYTLQDLGLKDFPRTSSGKVRKIDLKKIVEEHESLQNTNGHTNSHANRDTNGHQNGNTNESTESRLTRLWSRVIGVDAKLLNITSHIEEFADSITIMRLRSSIQRETGVAVSTQELIEAGTIKNQAAILQSKREKPSATALDIDSPTHNGPPTTVEMAITQGDDEVARQIQQKVSQSITLFGFNWEDDVEEVLPSWDLGEEIFGSIRGVSKVNFRATVAMKNADLSRLVAALQIAFKHHAMTRSFELRGVNGHATMRVIMRPNAKWFQYAIEEIPAAEGIEDLTKLLEEGVYFDTITDPYPALQFKVAHLKSSNTSALIWSAEHSAFDGLSLYSFLEDLDTLLADPKMTLKAHIPYKLWAEMYHSQRESAAARKAVRRQVRRVQDITSHDASIFPALKSAPHPEATLTHPSKRKTNICPPIWRVLPDLLDLKTEHKLSPFLLIKSALSVFLARKTGTEMAVLGQVENGRSWPSMEPWVQRLLPDCMDVAGPTLERSVQMVPIKSSTNPLELMRDLRSRQDEEAADVHAPWNLVREALTEEQRRLFDEASNSTLLNYIPIRTVNGQAVFNEMVYHGTRTNCDASWLYFCGVEGEGRETKFWTRIFSVNEFVRPDEALQWAEQVTEIAAWMANRDNWEKSLEHCSVLR